MRRLCAVVLLVASCRPDFAERESRVDRTQVLAVRLDPPEAKPGDLVTASLLVASPEGTAQASASWAFCATPRLLTENGAVSAACLANGVLPVGDALGPITAPLPAKACFDFGPEIQSAEQRPRDPDVTGGYFAPLRARVSLAGAAVVTAFGFPRIECNLVNASSDAAALFAMTYVPNQNPSLAPLEARLAGGESISLDAVPRGAAILLRASWSAEDAESYAFFDVGQQRMVTRRESMRVSWFATAGDFDKDRTGRTETEQETTTDNTWTAPDEASVTHIWLVLRDARGGIAFNDQTITTR